jgi:hypothetical protein
VLPIGYVRVSPRDVADVPLVLRPDDTPRVLDEPLHRAQVAARIVEVPRLHGHEH